MKSEDKNLKSTESEEKKLSEDELNELESTEVSGGAEDAIEDINVKQCGCNVRVCSVELESE